MEEPSSSLPGEPEKKSPFRDDVVIGYCRRCFRQGLLDAKARICVGAKRAWKCREIRAWRELKNNP